MQEEVVDLSDSEEETSDKEVFIKVRNAKNEIVTLKAGQKVIKLQQVNVNKSSVNETLAIEDLMKAIKKNNVSSEEKSEQEVRHSQTDEEENYEVMYVSEDVFDSLDTGGGDLVYENADGTDDTLDDQPDGGMEENFPSAGTSSKQSRRRDNDDSDSDADNGSGQASNFLKNLNSSVAKIKELRINNKVKLQCTFCSSKFEELQEITSHILEEHIPRDGPFFCVVCEKDCESYNDLQTHMGIHQGTYPYICFLCNKVYSLKRYLKRHMACHKDYSRYRCPKCAMRFKLKSELAAHAAVQHMDVALFKCGECSKVFTQKANYKRHLVKHMNPDDLPSFACGTCGKRFMNNRTLEAHTRIHTGEKPFVCTVCNKAFTQQGNLINHSRIHSNPRSYNCEVCGKSFNQRATLKDHSLLHTGEKPHVCSKCGMRFTFGTALRRHMWTHATVARPYGCEICGSRFIGKYDLKRHMTIHNGDIKAPRKPRVRRSKTNVSEAEAQLEFIKPDNQVEDQPTLFLEEVILEHNNPEILTTQKEGK